MLMVISLKTISTLEKIFLFRIILTDLLTMLNFTSKYQDTFQRTLLQLVQSHL